VPDGVVADKLGEREGVPAGTTEHSLWSPWLDEHPSVRAQVNRAVPRLAAITAVSDTVRRTVEDVLDRSVPVRSLPNVVDASVFTPGPRPGRHEAGRLLFVGAVRHVKGLDVLVRALPHLTEGHPSLAIVGDGPQREPVEELARELGVAHRLDWCGRVPDAAPLFRAFDLVVLSSRTEGTPMVVFEAMAAGVPVVATRVGGVPDQVSTRTGYLVPPEDPVALAQALDEALGSGAEAHRRATAARERLEGDFGADDWTDSYHTLYDRAFRRSAS
jgi:glycosyltransferase involved in cell wall biosynthesis